MTDEEIKDAASIIRQRVNAKGMLRMSEERAALLSSLLHDIDMLLLKKNGRPRKEIVALIEHELKV